jgi:tol-pal system protein YbgF
MSRSRISAPRVAFALLATLTFAAPALAQSREQRQLMADIRMLQEQNQTLQNLIGSIAEAIKAVNARIDEQAAVTGRALADQKLIVTNITNSVREVREKLDDNTVRLGSLSQEVDAVRMGLQQLSALPALNAPVPLSPDGGAPPGANSGTPTTGTSVAPPVASQPPPAVPGVADPSAAAAAPPASVTGPPAPPIGTSPQGLWDTAWADFTLGQYDLAIAGFQAVITYFPKSERAADAQVHIGHSYMNAGSYQQAIEAYDATIRNYPGSAGIPDAYFKKGLALKSLKQADAAQTAFEYVLKTYPDSSAAILARQQISQPKP